MGALRHADIAGRLGTEDGFRSAYAGWEDARRPAHILFYFCEEAIPANVAQENGIS